LVATVSTDVPDWTMDVGLKVAVANFGKPPTERFTVPENPCSAATATLYVVPAPRTVVWLDGVEDNEKSPTTFTTSVTVADRMSGPLVPLIVRTYDPGGVAAVVETFIVELPDPATDAGVNVAPAPDGSPFTLKATVPVNPACAATVAV
jgi:hypothetical protein